MPKTVLKASPDQVANISATLQGLQRQRSIVLKSRNMQAQRLTAIVAGAMGYDAGKQEKEELKARFAEAGKLIEEVRAGKDHFLKPVIDSTLIGLDAFENLKDKLEKEMKAAAKQLPVAEWIDQKEQRGFGTLFLAIVIGETGNLTHTGYDENGKPIGYPNPAKLWRRLGCAPWEFGGKCLMGATWKSGREGKLPAEEWVKYGYSPRRRSITYLIGEGLMKQNMITREGKVEWVGPYRAEYDRAKQRAIETRPHWLKCPRCEGTGAGVRKGSSCSNCKGEGRVYKRCHLHAMLLATKLLLKNLWHEWTGIPPVDPEVWREQWARK